MVVSELVGVDSAAMINKKPLEILIFGTGAVGSTIGWRVAQNPHTRLSVVCRSNYEAVKRRGIHLKTRMWGDGQFMPYRVVRSPREVVDVPFDYVVCANKVTSLDGLSFIKEIAPVVSQKTALVSAQNGVGVEALLRQVFPDNTILSAVCYVSCVQSAPGVIDQVSSLRPNALHVGAYDPREGHGGVLDEVKLERFVHLDEKFKYIGDVQAERWTKQIFNGSWNPMTAISGLDTHQLLASPYLHTVKQVAKEIFDVAIKSGVELAEDLPVRTIDFARDNPSLTPSMLQDARKKRPMEVESLCGNICRLADQMGVPVPTTKVIYHTLLEMNKRFLTPAEPILLRNQHLLGRSRSVPHLRAQRHVQATC